MCHHVMMTAKRKLRATANDRAVTRSFRFAVTITSSDMTHDAVSRCFSRCYSRPYADTRCATLAANSDSVNGFASTGRPVWRMNRAACALCRSPVMNTTFSA